MDSKRTQSPRRSCSRTRSPRSSRRTHTAFGKRRKCKTLRARAVFTRPHGNPHERTCASQDFGRRPSGPQIRVGCLEFRHSFGSVYRLYTRKIPGARNSRKRNNRMCLVLDRGFWYKFHPNPESNAGKASSSYVILLRGLKTPDLGWKRIRPNGEAACGSQQRQSSTRPHIGGSVLGIVNPIGPNQNAVSCKTDIVGTFAGFGRF